MPPQRGVPFNNRNVTGFDCQRLGRGHYSLEMVLTQDGVTDPLILHDAIDFTPKQLAKAFKGVLHEHHLGLRVDGLNDGAGKAALLYRYAFVPQVRDIKLVHYFGLDEHGES